MSPEARIAGFTCPHIRRLRSFSVDLCNFVAVAALTSVLVLV